MDDYINLVSADGLNIALSIILAIGGAWLTVIYSKRQDQSSKEMLKLASTQEGIVKNVRILQIGLSELELREKLGCIKENTIAVDNNADKRLLLVGDTQAALCIFRLVREPLQEEFIQVVDHALMKLFKKDHTEEFAELFNSISRTEAELRDTGEELAMMAAAKLHGLVETYRVVGKLTK